MRSTRSIRESATLGRGQKSRAGSGVDRALTIRLGVLARLPMLVLCLSLAAISRSATPRLLAASLLTAAATIAALLPAAGKPGRLTRAGEAVVWAVVVTTSGTVGSPYLTYLLAPSLVGGLLEGARAAVLVPGTAAAALLVLRAGRPQGVSTEDFSITAAQWVMLSVAVGVVGAWMRRLQSAPPGAPDQVQQDAHRLLLQLRTIARRLPGSLDPATTAEALLHELAKRVPVDEGWVLVRSGGDLLIPLASVGGGVLTWDVSLAANSALADAWATQQPEVRRGGHVRPDGRGSGGSALALPLTIGHSVFGIVAVQADRPGGYTQQHVSEAQECVSAVALPLDTGLLFDEIRATATAEERLRLSREIHDGVAQELASLGYALDDVATDIPAGPGQVGLLGIRQEVTRLVTELRMSLFDLRSGVDLHAGLGAALSEHVRRVGASSSFTVHLSLSEGALRLPPETESELLRIAQEAIANARRHSDAENLWVRCEVAPPRALLVIEDDGRGMDGLHRLDSHGLTIMGERAARAHADLQIGPRPSGEGTRVAVSVGMVGPGRGPDRVA